jgi:hypothetical protein
MSKSVKVSLISLVLITFLAGSPWGFLWTTGALAQLVGDLDSNYRVNFKDLRIFTLQWLDEDCLFSDCIADLDDVNGVNMDDFALLANNWQKVAPHIVISEFMASNAATLLDGDGESSDWIEIYNPTAIEINLDGWYLTINQDNLNMWQFPDGITVEPGEFLIIFASEKTKELYPENYPYLDSSGYYHTNFNLNKDKGDYLALVSDDSNAVVHEYWPEFPPQLTDISYGLAELPHNATTLVPTGAIATYHIPTISDAGTNWTAPEFDDSAWDTGPTSIGFGDVGGASGAILREYWTSITGGAVSDLTNNANYPFNPSGSSEPTSFEAPTDWADYYGTRMHGFLYPATTGVYTFWIASDDNSELWLSTNDDPINKARIAYVPGWTNPREWTTYAEQRSSSIALTAGQKYYIEALHKEDGGNDNLAVAWEGPGISRQVIDGQYLSPWTGSWVATDVQGDMRGVNASLWTRIEFELAEGQAETFDTLVLRMKYEDGFVAYLNGVPVASRNAPSPVEWYSAALSNRPIEDSYVFEEINLLAYLDTLQTGTNVLAIQGLNDDIFDGQFLVLPELVASINMSVPQYFAQPTPGTFNIAGAIGIVSDIWFSHKSGYYDAPFLLTLSTAMNDAEIHYTTDGSWPTMTHGTVYTGPFEVSATTTVRATAVKPGWLPAILETQAYIFLNPDILGFSTNLPIAVVDTFGGYIGQTTQTLCFAGFIDTNSTIEGRAMITDPTEFIGRAAINIRGKSSAGFPKHQYRLETWDEYNEDKDVSILGFPAESDWVLQGPYSDKSLMRNFLSYQWSNEIGQYAVRSRFIEMFLNTGGGAVSMSDYVGVYVFMEKIKLNKDRVDITKLELADNTEPRVTGGYIIKKDKFDTDDLTFYTSTGQHLIYVEPSALEITQAQRDWIKSYLDQFESALYGSNFTDPVDGYTKYIDVDSFFDIHILVELTKNIDGFRLSTYMYKDRGGKLNMGPAWDYNLSLGNADYLEGWIPQGWYNSLLSNADYPWWRRLFEDPEFRLHYADRWFGLRKTLFTTERLLGTVDSAAETLDEAQVRNFDRWLILGIDIWPNWFIAQTYQEEINWMKGWLEDRLTWMDSQIGTEFAAAPPQFNQQGGEVNPGFSLTMTAPSGTIYYTTDGSDPRQPVTGIPVGKLYTPFVLNKSTHVKARVLDGGTWSALNEAVFAVGPVVEGLRITEIMYHPQNTGNINDPNTEFIELKNIGQDTMNLNLVKFTEGINFTFPDTELEPNELVLVVKEPIAFYSKYGPIPPPTKVRGPYIGSLANDGEGIKLVDAIGRTIYDFEYKDGWYPITDGDGFSLITRGASDNTLQWPEEGLFAHWKLDDGPGSSIAIDSAGINHGILNGDPIWTTGRIDGALDFDGDGDYVSFGSITPLTGTSFTAQAWIRVDEAGTFYPILTQHDALGMLKEGCYFHVSAESKPTFYIINSFYSAQATSPDPIEANKWYHVAATNDGTELKLYVNGRFKDSDTSAGFTGFDTNAYIGYDISSTIDYSGLIDDVRIYDRALSEDEFPIIDDPKISWNQSGSWRPSVYRNGTPGWDDSGRLPNPGAVVINEVMSHSNAGPDWIELHNTTSEPINIGGWFLSDNDRDEPNLTKYRIADGTTIDSNDYIVFYQDANFGNTGDPGCIVPFALSENGDEACLSSRLDPNGMLTGYRDVENFGASQTNVSFGRYFKKSTGNFNFVAMDYNTPDVNNAYPKVGPVVINEIMYNPPNGNQNEEYIELHNITSLPVTLYRVEKSTPWKFTDGIDYTFSATSFATIPPGGYLMVVKDKTDFNTRYGIMPFGVDVVGGYDGFLSNAGERLQIAMPGDIDDFGTRYYIWIDRVNYSDGSHPEDCPGGVDDWPTEADGGGKSLSRKVPSDYGNDVANWKWADPSPGEANP